MMTTMPVSLDTTFAALADETRRAILTRLFEKEAAAGDLAAPHRMTLTAIMKHIRVLEEAGLVVREKRGRTVWCRLNGRQLRPATEWMDRYRVFWDRQLDSLADHLARKRQ
jgi:DNA-binding transcriptional ArsR family regulator